ncbi:MAG: transketolase [bacterium]|nr:transketolase [bacterium]
MEIDYIKDLKQIRWDIVKMVHHAKEGHIPSGLSVLEILYAIYKNKNKEDSFFLSKGHASAGLYAVLAHFGILKKEELDSFCDYDSWLGGHPHRKEGCFMNSSGSLGHGFPIAAGFALSKKIKEEPGRVFCLVGDGECNEGSIWETAMYAEQLKLSNLVCVVDDNNSQIRAKISTNLVEKFRAFGWEAQEVDGHNIPDIESLIFKDSAKVYSKPFCVVARTIKGKGIKAMEDDMFSWHHKAPTDDELEKFKAEIFK